MRLREAPLHFRIVGFFSFSIQPSLLVYNEVPFCLLTLCCLLTISTFCAAVLSRNGAMGLFATSFVVVAALFSTPIAAQSSLVTSAPASSASVSASASASAQTHTISVGIDHKFKPEVTQAEAGDVSRASRDLLSLRRMNILTLLNC